MEFRWKVKERARTYISRMPESLQGQGGSQAIFNVAAVIMRGFSLDEADGMELLAEWNEHHAHPRWSPVELRHKIRDGAKAERAEGYLLQRERERAGYASSSSNSARHHTPSHQTSQRPRSGTGPVPVEGAGGAEPQLADKSTPPDSHVHDGTKLVPLPAGELALRGECSASSKSARHHTPSHQTSQGPRSGTGPVPVEGAGGAEPQVADKNALPDSHVHDGTKLVPLPAGELALLSKKFPSCSCSYSCSCSCSSSSSACSTTLYAASRCAPPAPACTTGTTDRRTPPWPVFSPLTDDDCDRIAILRKVPGAAVEFVRRAGLLGKARYEGHDCFIMGEGRFAQARRFDGGLLPVQGGRKQSKAKNLPGSEGAFIGRKWAIGSRCPVLLVEGVIGLVEALAALMMARDCLDWTCLAAVSASSRFVRDPELRDALAGRKVHIIPDAGVVGRDAAGAWLAELEKTGAHVHLEPEPLPVACKDLGDVVARVYQGALASDDIHHHATLHRAVDDLREYLKAIFS